MYSNINDKDKFRFVGVKVDKTVAESFTKRCETYGTDKSEVLRGLIAKFMAGEVVLTKTIGG